jgi:hypothetical protein
MRNKSMSNIQRAAGVAAIVFSGLLAASAANAAATIVIINGNAAGVGFNDPTPAAPVGGNVGTTLGQQRLIAFQAVANKWGATLTSSVTIQVLATFEPLSCTATSAVLGSAGAISVWRDFPNVPIAGTWYSQALANKLAGLSLGTGADIRARFNSNLGQPTCLAGSPFYLGLDNNHGGLIDLVTVLTHEFGHGLGFQTFTNGSTGAQINDGTGGKPSTWDYFLRDTTQNLLWSEMTNAQRVASAINSRKLVWIGANVTAAAPGVLSAGVPLVQISGPAAGAATGTYDVGTADFGPRLGPAGVYGEVMPVTSVPPTTTNPGDACNPLSAVDTLAVSGKIALINRGGCVFTLKVKNAQNAGAIGVIVGDNVAGGPPTGITGADPTITIPTVRITLADANTFRTALAKRSRTKSGVFANLTVNSAQLAGADASGFVQLYTPNPFQSGSSVSHFDTGATRNLLMEPAINVDLTHEVTTPYDLTYELFKDIGW